MTWTTFLSILGFLELFVLELGASTDRQANLQAGGMRNMASWMNVKFGKKILPRKLLKRIHDE